MSATDLIVAKADGSYALAHPRRFLRIGLSWCRWCRRELPVGRLVVLTPAGQPCCGFTCAAHLDYAAVGWLAGRSG